MTKVFRSIADWSRFRNSRDWPRVQLGFVPTMGALHEGHAELIRRSRARNELTAVSIFVNPTQFNDPADLENYPRTLDHDLKILEREKVDYLLLPDEKQLYADAYRYVVTERELSRRFCGAHRPGHFDGVLTVVLKLLCLARPDRAYFGEKDYQQLKLVQGMADSFFLPTEIIPVPTVREADGLALSSRNRRLSADGRERARLFPAILRQAESAADARRRLTEVGFEVDYVEDWEQRRLAAIREAGVRLIDNVDITGAKT